MFKSFSSLGPAKTPPYQWSFLHYLGILFSCMQKKPQSNRCFSFSSTQRWSGWDWCSSCLSSSIRRLFLPFCFTILHVGLLYSWFLCSYKMADAPPAINLIFRSGLGGGKKVIRRKGNIYSRKANFSRHLQQSFTGVSLASILSNRYPSLQEKEKNVVLLVLLSLLLSSLLALGFFFVCLFVLLDTLLQRYK